MTENTVHATYLSQLQYPSAQGYLRQMAIGDFTLENGTVLPQVNIGYETWGTLNEAGDNAILILHALTGDTHVSRGIPTSDMPAPSIRAVESDGWWEGIVGPGAVVDTTKDFVIAPKILGGCYGSTGPASIVRAPENPGGHAFLTSLFATRYEPKLNLSPGWGLRVFTTSSADRSAAHAL